MLKPPRKQSAIKEKANYYFYYSLLIDRLIDNVDSTGSKRVVEIGQSAYYTERCVRGNSYSEDTHT